MFRYLILLVFMLGLGATAALAQSAADVELVQEKLSDYGTGNADGKMGKKTRTSIRAYQQDWQIPETGEITPDLISRLKGEHPATQSQWTKTADQDCEFWNAGPEPREVVTWTGDCTAGRTSGTGKLVWSYAKRGQSLQSNYEGQHIDGKQHGRGVMTWADGSRYEGQYKDGNKHGQGVKTWANGDRYEGQYINGKQHGSGTYTWADGSRYEGRWKDGHKHGQGVEIWADGSRYEGRWNDGKPHGSGVYIARNGRGENRRWNNGCSAGRKTNRAIGRSMKSCGF